ncbi:hypothetical protein PM082_008871 [Marasmius tenuissimus]|nr:hypothetical protein PM082_008871 [Marasmius tenuissimus]
MDDIPDDFRKGFAEFRDFVLVSSWMNMFLYTTEVALIVYAYAHLRLNRFHRYLLVASLLTDTACTAIVCYSFWLVIAGPITVDGQPWPLGAIIILTYMSSAWGQIYFVHRYWIIARNKIVSGLIVFGILVHVVFGFIAAIYVFVIRRIGYHFGVSASAVAATVCATTDILIAGSMFLKLRRIQTFNTSTQNLLARISLLAISSGVITATATTLMIVFLFTSHFNVFNLIFNSLGRIYTITIVVNSILVKQHHESVISHETSLSRSRSTRSRIPRRIRTGTEDRTSVVFAPIEFQTFTVPDLDLDDSDPSDPSHQLATKDSGTGMGSRRRSIDSGQ